MTPEKWERWCRRRGFIPKQKMMHRHGVIYFAESPVLPPRADAQTELEQKVSHILLLWAIERGTLDVGKVMCFSAVHHPLENDRRNMAMVDIEDWIKVNLDKGRYVH